MAVDVALTGIAVLPWAFPGPSPVVRIVAVATCVTCGLVARFVTKSFEMPVAVLILSILAYLLLGVLG